MRLAVSSLSAVIMLLAAACSSEPAPGSAEWCKNTPAEKQAEDPTAMMKCAELPAS